MSPTTVIAGLTDLRSERWLTHAVIDEFSRIEEIKGQRASNVLTAAKARRRALMLLQN